MALLKKEFLVSYLLIVVFALFLYTAKETAEQIIYFFTEKQFVYYKLAYLNTFHIILLIVSIALLFVLNRNENVSDKEKGNAFASYVMWTVFSFFPGWIIHLYFVIQTVKLEASFMVLEQNFLVYFAHEISLLIGFCLSGFLILKPVLHKGEV